MDELNGIFEEKHNSLLKLKEERDKLIKWSLQLKNSTTPFLRNGNEKEKEKENGNGNGNRDANGNIQTEEHSTKDKTKLIDMKCGIRIKNQPEENELDSFYRLKKNNSLLTKGNDTTNIHLNGTNKEAQVCKINIKRNTQNNNNNNYNNNNNNIHIHLKQKKFDEEANEFISKQKFTKKDSSSDNEDIIKSPQKLLQRMKEYKETLNNEKRFNDDGNSSDMYNNYSFDDDKTNKILYGATNKISNHSPNDLLNDYSCSDDISDTNSSFPSVADYIKKRTEMKKKEESAMKTNEEYINGKYKKSTYNIEIKKPLCTNIKHDSSNNNNNNNKKTKNKRGRNHMEGYTNIDSNTNLSKSNNSKRSTISTDPLSRNSVNFSNTTKTGSTTLNNSEVNSTSVHNKKKIKLRRKKEKEPAFTYIQSEKDNNKSSNDSTNTFLPVGSSFFNSNQNSSCTTANSSRDVFKPNDRNKNEVTKTENYKIAESEKITNLLKNQVQMLGKKKENLNDKMNDLHDNVYTLIDKNKRDNLTVKHYEVLIKSLETKYNKLFNMYQELEEHRTSYVDAYREKQTKIENLSACIQIKSEENLKMEQEIKILNNKTENLQGQIYEYIKDIEEKDKQLNKKKEEIVNLKAEIQQLKQEIAELKKQLDATVNELNEMTKKYTIFKEENLLLKERFSELEKECNNLHKFYHGKIDSLQELLKKILFIFQLNSDNIMNYAKIFKDNVELIEEKLKDNQSKYDDILQLLGEDITKPIQDIVLEREKEHAEQKQEMENAFDTQCLQMYETNLQNVEIANNQIYGLKEKLTAAISQRDITKYRALLLTNGQGRLNDKSVIPDVKKTHEGTLLYKFKYRSFTHKPVLIYMKIINNTHITWTKDKYGQKRFKRRNLIELKNVISIDYGLTARPVYWHIEKKNQKKLEKNQIQANEFYDNPLKIIPYKCFTIYTKTRAYDFFAEDENILANWVIGLGRLCSEYTTNPNIQSRSEFIVKKAKLKLKLYCIKNNISYVTLWKEAIRKAKAQLNISNTN